jgi:hypothetical protein
MTIVRVMGELGQNTYIGALFLETEKKEVDVRKLWSLAVGMGIGRWRGLDEGEC